MNHFKLNYRNFIKHKPYSFLSLVGLSIGLCVTFIVILYITEETGYDTFNEKHENIYRVLNYNIQDKQAVSSIINIKLGKAFQEKIPEIKDVVFYRNITTQIGEKSNIDGVYYASPNIADVFTFSLSSGSFENFKNDKEKIIISEKFSLKHFGKINAVGETLTEGWRGNEKEYIVAAVFKNFPKKSTLSPNVIIPFQNSRSYASQRDNFGVSFYHLYLLLSKNASITEVNSKMNAIAKSSIARSSQEEYSLQSLKKTHLYSDNIRFGNSSGSIQKVIFYASIGVIVLLISLINFLILNTAITKRRFKEITIRKVNGLSKNGLLKLFLIESFLTSIVASTTAFVLMKLLIPFINDYTKSAITFSVLDNYQFLGYCFILVALITLLSALFFIHYINKYSFVEMLHKKINIKERSFFVDNGAMIIQVVVISTMLIFSLAYNKQLDFLVNSDKGYNNENMLFIPGYSFEYNLFSKEIVNQTAIENVARGNILPMHSSGYSTHIQPKDQPENKVLVELLQVGYNYIPTYGITVKKGRNFSQNFSTDTTNAVIINETAAKHLNLNDPIGVETNLGKIVGVIQDLKFESFKKPVRPLILKYTKTENYEFGIKYKKGEKKQAIQLVTPYVHKDIISLGYFDPNFVETQNNIMYEKEYTFKKVILILTLLALFITLLGLVGISLFKAGQRTKEIGIRKVNGASIKEIILLLNKDFVKWLLIAFIMACPIGYFLANRWLEGFAYKTSISWWVFIVSGVFIFVISLLTVSIQSYRASRANPIKSLRTE